VATQLAVAVAVAVAAALTVVLCSVDAYMIQMIYLVVSVACVSPGSNRARDALVLRRQEVGRQASPLQVMDPRQRRANAALCLGELPALHLQLSPGTAPLRSDRLAPRFGVLGSHERSGPAGLGLAPPGLFCVDELLLQVQVTTGFGHLIKKMKRKPLRKLLGSAKQQ
jgi:hypothetical protein